MDSEKKRCLKKGKPLFLSSDARVAFKRGEKRVIIKAPRKNRKYRNREINKFREFDVTNTLE